jgi:hypothetical protein
VIGGLLIVAALGAGAFAALRSRRTTETGPGAALLVHVHAGLRYEYHVPTGREGLYDAARDPRGLSNVIDKHRDVAAICRRALEEEQKVESLDVLRERYAEEIRRLRALGYL